MYRLRIINLSYNEGVAQLPTTNQQLINACTQKSSQESCCLRGCLGRTEESIVVVKQNEMFTYSILL